MATLTTVVVACVDSCHYVKSNPIIYVTNLETRKYRYLSERVRAFQAKVATYQLAMSSSYGGYHSQSYAPSAPEQPPYSNYNHTSSSTSNSSSSSFPAGTPQDVIRSFQMVDRDRSGFIDERELQQALSSGFHHFNLRTIRFLMFLFKSPNLPLTIGT